jgi:hypothetical protein
MKSVVTLVIAIAMFLSSVAVASDELYYSAALCTPVWQHGFHGSGEEGFEWIIGVSPLYYGFWANHDTDNYETLVCPIPYDGSDESFEVRVVVNDNHPTKSVKAKVMLSDNGPPHEGDSASSGTGWVGIKTLFLTVDPNDDDRWVTLYVEVPDEQSDSRSWVTGYRVCRDCD